MVIAAKPSVLRNLNSILVEDVLDLDDADHDVTAEVAIKEYLPDNTVLAEGDFDGIVRLTAEIEEEAVRTIEIPMENITLTNVPEGFRAKLRGIEDIVLVKFAGLDSQLGGLNVDDLYGTIDVSAYFAHEGEDVVIMPGSYYPAAAFELPEYVYVKDGGTVHIVLEEE